MANTLYHRHNRAALRTRAGGPPRTTTCNLHMQLDQQPGTSFTPDIAEAAAGLANVVLAPSRRAPPGTVGFYIHPDHANGPPEAFLLGTEFAHVHPGPDHAQHLTLPEPLRTQAIHQGWAEPHPVAGYPTVSSHFVLLYAPRDREELQVVQTLIRASWGYAVR